MDVFLTKIGFFQSFRGDIVANWHQANVYKVGAARAAEVGMGEAVDDMLIVVVT